MREFAQGLALGIDGIITEETANDGAAPRACDRVGHTLMDDQGMEGEAIAGLQGPGGDAVFIALGLEIGDALKLLAAMLGTVTHSIERRKPAVPEMRAENIFDRGFLWYRIERHPGGAKLAAFDGAVGLILMPRHA